MLALSILLAVLVYQATAMPMPGMRNTHPAGGNSTFPHSGVMGLDLSTSTSLSAFKCLVNEGYHFTIVRAYESVGQPDRSAPASITNAWAGGMRDVDVYLFPCFHCGNPASQVRSMVSYLEEHSSKYGMIWLDVEGTWGSEEESQQFFHELYEEARLHKRTGVYTSKYMWENIMGSSYSGGSTANLWYAHYDDNPSFSDFEPFGGWSHASIKQYEGDKFSCGAGIDKNWYP